MKNIFIPLIAVFLFTGCTEKKTIKTDNISESTNDTSTVFKPANIEEQLKYHRAIEAVIWGMPAVNYDAMYQAGIRDAKAGSNQIVYWSRPEWKNQTLTPNADALYIFPFMNTKDTGPVVLEIPPADTGSIVGTIMDCWQLALEDVGPAGVDKGKGGKYLILPPGYKKTVPAGYIVLQSPTYESFALLRSIPKSNSDADLANAVTYLKRIKLYPLSETAKSPQTVFKDSYGTLFNAAIPYNMQFFKSLDRIVQTQPWMERDKALINTLASIGIQKGKPFNPDAKTQSMMLSAVKQAHEWATNYYETQFEPFFKTSRWFVPSNPELIKDVGEGFSNPDSYPIDVRGSLFTTVFSTIKHLGAGQFYLFVTRDKNGQPLDGNKNYQLHVPANVPARQYWSVTLYDFATHTLIRDVSHASRSSLKADLKKNEDGSVDIYFGPKPPAGKEPNWVPTKQDGRFEAIFRLYAPDKSFFEKKTWMLPDIEEVE